ncbi:MAG: phosphoglycerate kinase [Anaerolineae bacterium]
MIKTVKDIDVANKRVLVRADFNVPLDDGRVADDTRIRACLPTVRYLLDHEARVILCSHLGRPGGKVVEALRLDPVGRRLSELLDRPVDKLDDCVGSAVLQATSALLPGKVLLLENTRFHPGEKANDPEFAARLAKTADVYVDDAFGTAHRAHASTEGVAHHLPAVGGLLMERELEVLGRVRENPAHPFVAILGGAKISTKIDVMQHLLDQVETLMVGGAMANTFLLAQGREVGESLVEEDRLDTARQILDKAGDRLILPQDVVIAREMEADAERRTVSVDGVPAGWRILDVGPETIERFKEEMKPARMVMWNGPLGAFEVKPFAQATYALARALADLDAETITGGGETAAAVNDVGVADRLTHVSTGGGAFLEFMEGKELPGVAVLQKK